MRPARVRRAGVPRPIRRPSATRWRISSRETTVDASQCVAPGTSMYSMKRISAPRAPAYVTSASTSSSLTPRIRTVSSFIDPKASMAASMPASTSGEVIAARQGLEAVGHQRVEADGDAAQARVAQSLGVGASSTPLVVIARSSSAPSPAIWAVNSATWARRSGSPPVNRTWRTPSPTKMRVTRVSSSKVSSVALRQPDVVRLRHAVRAPQVAAIGDRDAEVAERTLPPVEDHRGIIPLQRRTQNADVPPKPWRTAERRRKRPPIRCPRIGGVRLRRAAPEAEACSCRDGRSGHVIEQVGAGLSLEGGRDLAVLADVEAIGLGVR